MLVPKRYCLICLRRYGLILVFISVAILAVFNLVFDFNSWNINSTMATNKNIDGANEQASLKILIKDSLISKIPSVAEIKQKSISDKVKRLSKKVKGSNLTKFLYSKPPEKPNYNVHIFYYPWYRNVQYDGDWKHWNHEYIPNWKKDDMKVYPTGKHTPPEDIGSNFYPSLGCYSSKDPEVVKTHMKQIRDAGIGVLVVSWYPPHEKDASDEIFLMLLEIAKSFELHVIPHMEPYNGRNIVNLRTYIRYIIDKFGNHEAFHRMLVDGKMLPVFYVYDSYQIESTEWKEMFSKTGQLSIRGTEYDGVFFGLVVDMQHRYDIKKSHFDGFYTYFASNGFSYGSSWKNWQVLGKFANTQNLLFSPSVGAGYIDTTVRPWNAGTTRHRRHGHYYEVAWRAALSSQPSVMSITSFNEWHEGTQIEPAISKRTANFTYLDYEPEGPYFYLNLTRYWVRKYSNNDNKGTALL